MREHAFGGEDISRKFGKKVVLNGASFSLPLSGVAGIFGLNGSGKTTLLRILAGLDGDFSGELYKTDFEDVAYMTTEGSFPFGMNVKGAVEFYDTFTRGLQRDKIFEAAQEAGISLKSPIFSLSSGMKQYFKFLLTAYSGASVCLFDEPLSNLDVNMRERIARTMIMECGRGAAVYRHHARDQGNRGAHRRISHLKGREIVGILCERGRAREHGQERCGIL